MQENNQYEQQYEQYSLYIPRGAKEKTEIFAGWSKEEFIQGLVPTIILLVIASIMYVISFNIFISILTFFIGIGAIFIFLAKNENNQSAYDYLFFIIRFSKNQKDYKYKSLDELS